MINTIKIVFNQVSEFVNWDLILNIILEKGNPKLLRVKYYGKGVLLARVQGNLDQINRVIAGLQKLPGISEAKIETHPHWD
ncbi:MAG: hypothetical protein BWY24_00183 [Microgenomates group bacterium ADurb.Bin219]|nr:MAG: hypothetical protein BWY24_00183 [Microgenomates group bacterium ADurb.Bin219]HNP89012.1 hypothetical protein [Candidatus Woesebacteria bacterium]